MTIRMLINATAPDELRIAIVEDGELIDLDIEAAETSTIRGNIYKGVVHNVEASLEAAFVDFGHRKQGFLPFSEIAPSQYYRKWNQKEPPRITDVVRRGQDIIVQVGKDAIGEKGATLTTYLSLAGRYTVLMPDSEANGISRKIDDERMRKRVRSMAQKLKKPEGCGFIVRTAGLHQTRVGIQKDLDKLTEQLTRLRKSAEIARAPSVMHSEPDLIARTLRDIFNDEVDEVWIDQRGEYDAALEYFKDVMPDYVERIHHHQDPIPIFAYYRVEEQIEATFGRKVGLPSGGSIVIDQTEALVAVDVNSGKNTSEGGHEETVFRTNCEAAEEVARQMRLRDLGGIVVVDFIDMEVTKHKREVEAILAEAAKDDKARWKISRINAKGLCVFTRQRIRQGMVKAFQRRCSVCDGTGWVRTEESHALSLLRRIEARLAQGGVGEVRVKTHRDTAAYILNHKRSELLSLERRFSCRVVVEARADIERAQDELSFLSKGELLAEITDRLPPREERRRERGGRRKKKRKKADPDARLFDDGEDKKKKKKKADKSEAKRREPEAKRGEAEAKRSARPEEQRGPEELKAKGDTTFTGRPSPEQLAKLKEERRKRAAARGKGNALVATGPKAIAKPGERALSVKPPAPQAGPEAAPKESGLEAPTQPELPLLAPSAKSDEGGAARADKGVVAEPVAAAPRVPKRDEGVAERPSAKPSAGELEAPEVARATPVVRTEDKEQAERRRSLLDRIFGAG